VRPIRTIVVEDEPGSRNWLRSMLARQSDVEVVQDCRNGAEAIDAIRRLAPDLVFLDIRMPDMDGFDVLGQLDRAERPRVVFVTAHDEFAVRAFELHALDYLLKPFDEPRLAETLSRVRAHFGERQDRELGRRVDELMRHLDAAGRRIERLAVKQGETTRVIRVRDVAWLEAEANDVRLHTAEGSFVTRASLQRLEERLDPRQFARIQRGIIVNVDRVRRLAPRGRGDLTVTLADGTELPLSRRYRERLERLID
jgi:two-component system LytT family response regulator